jgi:RHS repeat-associated protein
MSLAVGTHTVTAAYFMADQTPSGTATQTISVTGPTPSGYSYSITDSSITDSNSNSGYAANGNVVAYTDSINGQWTLGYDSVNRLASATTAGQNICWTYDSFGNRTAQTVSSTPCGSSVSTVQYPNNQNPNLGYDASGDVWNDGTNQYLYDAEGRICAVQFPVIAGGPPAMMHYLYDAEGRRVAKGTITVWSCDTTSNGFIESNGYMIGPDGGQLTEVDGQGGPIHSNIFANGHLIATYDSQNVHFHLSDWLGTRRVTADYVGNIESTYKSLPFGEMIPQNQNLGATEHFFTGKERDSESGLDYFGYRHYSSAMGRWISPDPTGLDYADLTNPQSFNLYSYVLNNPLKFVDPNGLYCAWEDGTSDDDPKDGGATKKQCTDQGGHWTDQANPCNGADGCTSTFDWNPPKKPCVQSALRAVVATGEVPREPNGGYGTVARGVVISAPASTGISPGTRNAHIADPSSLSGHPNILVQVGPGLRSTAFGRYQINVATANDSQFTDFSPNGQDAAANTLLGLKIHGQSATGLAMQGDIKGAISQMGGRWASMPDSPYNQPHISWESALYAYGNAIVNGSGCSDQ